MTEQTCKTCRYCKTGTRERLGYCRLDPPVFTGNNDEGYPRFFAPVVTLDNFCASWDGA